VITIFLISALVYIMLAGIPPVIVVQRLFGGINTSALLAIPFFVLAGDLMNVGGLAKRLVNLANAFVGNTTGGLAIVTVIGCMFFAAISGSGVATAAAIGSIMIPYMIKRGYEPAFACAVVACAAPIGVIIPPSISYVIVGVLAQVSIADLYKVGIPAGVIVGMLLIAVSWFISKKKGYKGEDVKFSWRNIGKNFVESAWALGTPVILIGGVFGGIFTPTESAVVAVIYAIVVGKFIYKESSWKDMANVYILSSKTAGKILFIIANASLFAWVLTIERVPQMVLESLLTVSTSPVITLLIINVILLIAGCFMESGSIQVITIPLLWPIIQKMGIDPAHFGVVMTANLAIGLMTPPFGVVLFTTASVSGISVQRIITRVMPLFLAMIVALGIITYVPQSVMWLLNR
jgi:C4-dicarboxylate transporter DctM subunit